MCVFVRASVLGENYERRPAPCNVQWNPISKMKTKYATRRNGAPNRSLRTTMTIRFPRRRGPMLRRSTTINAAPPSTTIRMKTTTLSMNHSIYLRLRMIFSYPLGKRCISRRSTNFSVISHPSFVCLHSYLNISVHLSSNPSISIICSSHKSISVCFDCSSNKTTTMASPTHRRQTSRASSISRSSPWTISPGRTFSNCTLAIIRN